MFGLSFSLFSTTAPEALGIYPYAFPPAPTSSDEPTEPLPITNTNEPILQQEDALEIPQDGVPQESDWEARAALSPQESFLTNADVQPDVLNVSQPGPKKVDLQDDSTWAEEPPIGSPANRSSLTSASQFSQMTTSEDYVVEKLVLTEVRGNPELLQEAEKIIDSLYTKPPSSTFFVTLTGGERKEYYRPPFGLDTLLSVGQKLAFDCKYPTDVTVSTENHRNGIVYACMTFRKKIDHAQKTYYELRKKWNLEETQEQPLTFAISRGIWGMYNSDSKYVIEQLEKKRTQVIEQFCQDLCESGIPKEPAFERIYRPTAEERRQLLEGADNLVEYIAATDCVLFIHKPVVA